MKSHFEPTPSVIAERYRFHRRDQASGESIANYVVELRKLTTHCKFEERKDFLQESLRDRFVCGLRSESIRKRLLTEDQKVTFAKAMELAKNLETASKDAQLKASEQIPCENTAVHKVTSPSEKESCYRCGLTNHKTADCRFKETICHQCGKQRHIRRVCRSGAQSQRRGKKGTAHKRTRWVNKDQNDKDSDGSVDVHIVGKWSTRPIRVEVQINSKPLLMKVDTGAAVSLISYKKLKQVLPRVYSGPPSPMDLAFPPMAMVTH